MCASGTVNTICFVWKSSCLTFHSLIHAYKYIKDPFHLDFRACAMDWRVKSAGSRVGTRQLGCWPSS